MLWYIDANALPVKARLPKALRGRGIRCPLCDNEDETSQHLFGTCSFARTLWFASPWGLREPLRTANSGYELVNLILNQPIPDGDLSLSSKFITFAALLTDVIWRVRNEVLFQGKLGLARSMKGRIWIDWNQILLNQEFSKRYISTVLHKFQYGLMHLTRME